MTQVFIKRYWGFRPEMSPVAAFGKKSSRDDLAARSNPGDLIVFVGTKGEETRQEERGRILGIAEFGQRHINNPEGLLREINPALNNSDKRFFDDNGKFRWPFALPVLRAWRFSDPPNLTDIMEQLPIEARYQAVLLSDADAKKILALPSVEVTLPSAIHSFRDLNGRNSPPPHNPTTGPQPISGTWHIEHTAATDPAYTYALQFGSYNLWKIGLAKDTKKRLSDINKHIPHEAIGEQWELILAQPWPTGTLAYKMEQSVLAHLQKFRTSGERVQCSREELDAAWKSAYLEIT